jgi:glycosyltransferase involved in cell wall biosynthesis
MTVVHSATSHILEMRRILDPAFRAAGRRPLIGDGDVSRALTEYAEADLVRAQSTRVLETLVENGVAESKVFLVPPSIDLESFRPRETAAPKAFTVAFVGTFSIRKGIQVLLAAWDRFARPDDRLILQGGPDSAWSKKLIGPYRSDKGVEFRSGPPHRTYADASVVVVPSLEDGFCYVVLEAMACGLPVIVTDKVGAKDLVSEGVDGFVIPAGDSDAIIDRLTFLRDHPTVIDGVGRAGVATAQAYTFEAEGRNLDRVFTERL